MPTGLTEARWVRAIEIRPVGKNARKITHHALARLQQPEDMDPALFTNDPNVSGDGLFMEGAVGKNGDEMRPDSGRIFVFGEEVSAMPEEDLFALRARILVEFPMTCKAAPR